MKDFNDMISKDSKTLADVKRVIDEQLQLATLAPSESGTNEPVSTQPTIDTLLDYQEKRLKKYKGCDFLGLPQKTLPKLDELLLGLRKFIVLGAPPNVGKTAFTLQLGIDVLLNNPKACLVFLSLEMSREDILDRTLSHLSKMSLEKLYFGTTKNEHNEGWYTKQEVEILDKSKKKMKDIGKRFIILDEDYFTNKKVDIDANGIMKEVKILKNSSKSTNAIVIIDYLQVQPIPKEKKSALHSDIDRDRCRIDELKKLRLKLEDDPLIVITEIRKLTKNGSNKKIEKPTLEDIMGSARTAYGADCSMFLYEISYEELIDGFKDKNENQKASLKGYMKKNGISIVELIIPKARDAMRRGSILLAFYFQENRFEETSYEKIENNYKEQTTEVLNSFPNMASQNKKKKSKIYSTRPPIGRSILKKGNKA